ncbi:MAG: carbohydrate binding family 9 domain-containing protein [Candidatus Aminicenantes bacterium]|nr:carbohydrate binding family 9 domain-containing protein [Candidatus Aminicenantes bacterium]
MRRRIFYLGIFLLVTLLLSNLSISEEKILKIPRLTSPPKIDGILENPVWEQEALKIEEFLQFAPKEKGTPSEKTVAYLGYDQKNLYIAIRCYDSEPQKIRASITNRDNLYDDDWVVIFLDTFNERRRAFEFFINPVGVQGDAIRTEEGGNENESDSWDTAFYTDGKINEEGYTIEMALPFKSIRFPDKENKVWNIAIGRNIPRKGEIITWPGMSREIPGLIVQGREFLIQGKVEKGKNLEVMPLITSLKTQDEKVDLQPGVNLKYGVSSDITLDFTLNPDFSHIEADAPQIDINQRFALYYSEKRPFFLEGMEIFQFPEIEMVYTRRIINPFLGAKLTGKVGRLTYGFLSAYDLNPTESLWEVHNGGDSRDDNALFNIFRMKTDVFQESYLGFSMADKEIDGSYNRVAGVDGQFKFKNKYFFSFQALASKTKSGEEDTSAAPALYGNFLYYTKHWVAGVNWKAIHPDFEASSGFVNRVDYKRMGAFTSFRTFPEKKYLNVVYFNLSAGNMNAYNENIMTDKWAEAEVNFEFTQFSRLYVSFQNYMERYGGINFHKNSFTLNGSTNLIGWLPFEFYFRTGDNISYDSDDPFLGWSNTYGVFLNFKPSNRLQMGFDLSKNTFYEERGGKQLWDYNIIRQRTTYQISKTLSLRAIIDYNHYYKKIYNSFLVSYILRPGTVFFLGVDSNFLQDEAGSYARTGYSVFIKFSYWWRI